jgi:hypothetical protein
VSKPKRTSSGQFAPGGGSPNPGGRPKLTEEHREHLRALKEQAATHTQELIGIAVQLAKDPNVEPRDRLGFIRFVTELDAGRPSAARPADEKTAALADLKLKHEGELAQARAAELAAKDQLKEALRRVDELENTTGRRLVQ